jgi:hypothetical protein
VGVGRKAVSRVACPQGVEDLGMAGPSDTSGSPWPPLAIRPCSKATDTDDKWWRKHEQQKSNMHCVPVRGVHHGVSKGVVPSHLPCKEAPLKRP